MRGMYHTQMILKIFHNWKQRFSWLKVEVIYPSKGKIFKEFKEFGVTTNCYNNLAKGYVKKR